MTESGRSRIEERISAEARGLRVVEVSDLLDDNKLQVIKRQPGVLAVLAFYEGFPVKSIGNGDFEQVAAVAEDILRAGERTANDMRMGTLDQIVLEAGEKKCIIAPHGDLALCTITRADANLGMVRLAIRQLQRMKH